MVENNERLCIKYPSNMSEMLLKILFFFGLTIFMGYAIYSALNEDLIVIISLGVFL